MHPSRADVEGKRSDPMHYRVQRLAHPALLLVALLLALTACGGSPPPTALKASSGDVRITTDRAAYGAHTPIGVTLTNVSKTDYYSRDGRSGCTLVQLQRLDGNGHTWVSVYGCGDPGYPHALVVPSGIREPFTLAPGAAPGSNSWDSGTYRVAATYTSNSDGVTDEQLAYSAAFTIQG